MLCISLRAGDYVLIGGDTVVQYDHLKGDRLYLNITAPREVPILRGEVLERDGGRRPACVQDAGPRFVKQLPWDRSKKEALAQLRMTLERMEDSPETRALRDQLDRIFPPPRETPEHPTT